MFEKNSFRANYAGKPIAGGFTSLASILGFKIFVPFSLTRKTHKKTIPLAIKQPPKLRLVYFAWKGDLKARKQCHEFTDYYRCKRLCDKCSAVQPMSSAPEPFSYKNMSPNAPYVGTEKDHNAYIRTARCISPWAVVDGWQYESVSFDMMHIVFLGIAKNHVPSCLKLLRHRGFYYEHGESDAEFLKRVSMEMKQDCKDRKFLAVYTWKRLRLYECDM